jgi:hypothetical protein
VASGVIGALAAGAIFTSDHEPERLPVFVDRARLVIHQAGLEADGLDLLEREIARYRRCFLGPGNPQPARRGQRLRQRAETTAQCGSSRVEVDDHVERTLDPTSDFRIRRERAEGRTEAPRFADESYRCAFLDPQLLEKRCARVVLVADAAQETRLET